MGRELLLTGATGFVGKVLLRALMRRAEALDLDRVHLLVRSLGEGATAERRIDRATRAALFRDLPAGWRERVSVVEGDLSKKDCGIREAEQARLLARLTHVLHAAAAVAFDLPPPLAAEANVAASLRVQELAGRTRLERFVHVSTAYVTPHRGVTVPVEEALAPLPRPAEALWRACRDPEAPAAALLAETGHPNTYTLTKCLAEHLLAERRGDMPLTLVRPSIVSATWRDPFPGWIDSAAAFAAFVVLVGSGAMRAVVGDPAARVDLVPVDWVAERAIDACFAPASEGAEGDAPVVRHLTAGLEAAPNLAACRDGIVACFGRTPLERPPRVAYLGPPGLRFRLADWRHHRIPAALARLRGEEAGRSRRSLAEIARLNAQFSYFTRRSFDFRACEPLTSTLPDWDAEAYVSIASDGVRRHLLRRPLEV